MMRTIVALALLALACDPPDSSKRSAVKLEEPRTNVTGDRKAQSDCLAGCDGEKLSETDRATCRLNCETAHKVTPTPAADGDDAIGRAMQCMRGCRKPPGAAPDADAGACTTACRTSAASATDAPASDVLERLGACVDACHADKATSDTDRATCELQCGQAARASRP